MVMVTDITKLVVPLAVALASSFFSPQKKKKRKQIKKEF
jgi:hypothetical protein